MRRIYIPELSVHVIRRGNNRCAIFRDDRDRQVFLAAFRDAAQKSRTTVHAFVLMDTHYHAVVSPGQSDSLSSMMKALGEEYVRYVNGKYDRVGTLWAGRYRSPIIESEQYWLNCVRYVEQNPVRAGMVASPAEYPWSSYRFHAYGESMDWLTEHAVYQALGATGEERRAAYRALCDVQLTDEELIGVRRRRIRQPDTLPPVVRTRDGLTAV
jgi:REP-associated tyrosine transposase